MTNKKEAISIRNEEASWLQEAMNRSGTGNLKLHQKLEDVGFDGFPNNISMWRKAKTQIPDRWAPDVCKLLFPESADTEIVNFLRRRHPEFSEYINLKSGAEKISENLKQPTLNKLMKITYIPKNGTHRGVKFIPFVNKLGKYQGGVDRFKESIEEFNSIQELLGRLNANDDFKVRMMHPDNPAVAPSLIKKDSLITT